ncbi:MAG: hypothetical protein JWP02_3984 [Acidimicrobiales bacterium]|nr:hypothetical protein [Acidimicrobiales bacterium]
MHLADTAGFERLWSLLSRLDAFALREDELAPHVVLVIDEELGPGPAVGPFDGALPALVAAERLEAALNDTTSDAPVRTQVLRLFNRRR